MVSIALTAATVGLCTARLHKTSRRDAMARDPRREILSRDRDILLRDRDETSVPLETVSRPRRLDRDHIPGSTNWQLSAIARC